MRPEVWMISFDEECADQNYQRLRGVIPAAKLIQGVKGIRQAYTQAAEGCLSQDLFLIDADNWVLDAFNSDFIDSMASGSPKVFYSRNDFGISYGHGGIKLVSRNAVLRASQEAGSGGFLDFTELMLGGAYPYEPLVMSEHRLGEGFRRWRSIFREVLKCGLRNHDLLDLWLEHEEPRAIFEMDVLAFLRTRTPQQIFDDINNYTALREIYENRRLLHL